MLIYLCGYMGSGKTTVAEKLAKKTGHAFVDLDQLIEQKNKKSIADIFEQKGEEFFREAEKEMLHTTFVMENTIVACGGGTPCFFDNMEQMNEHGLTVYLKLAPGSLFHRLAPGKAKRPLIANMPDLPLMEFIIKEIQKREPFYEMATIIIKGESLKTDELVEVVQKEMTP